MFLNHYLIGQTVNCTNISYKTFELIQIFCLYLIHRDGRFFLALISKEFAPHAA